MLFLNVSEIAILTAYTDSFLPLQEITSINLKKYSLKHNYNLFIEIIKERDRPASWYKVTKILELFKKNYKYIMWIDCDATIINDEIKIEPILEKDKEFYICRDFNGINCGVFIMQNTINNINFLQKVWFQTEFIFYDWWEQAAMMFLIYKKEYPESKIKYLDEKIFNNRSYDENCLIYHLSNTPFEVRIEKFKKCIKPVT
jgi:hypothetical protein